MIDHSFISYVNLEKRPERRAKMEAELKRVGIPAVRTRGMLPEEYSGSNARIQGMRNRTQKGAIGCYFSQLSIMERAAGMKKHAFVMEDDLLFCDDFLDRMQIINQFCDNNPWDVIWLGATFHVNPPYWHKDHPPFRDAELTDNPRMIRTYAAFCTYAYIVNYFSIHRVMGLLEEYLPKSWGIDHSFIHIEPQLFTYAFVPGSVIQYDHQSDIGDGVTMFSNFKKLGPYWFAKRMSEFDPTTFNWNEAKTILVR
jgi:GR25 family glycosyltransferase involved in LPS biosynthesis